MVRSQMRHAFCVRGAWVSLWINGAVWWWPPSVPAAISCYQLSCSINGTPKTCTRRVHGRGWVWGHWVNWACQMKTGSVGVEIGEFGQHVELKPLIQSSPWKHFSSFSIIFHHFSSCFHHFSSSFTSFSPVTMWTGAGLARHSDNRHRPWVSDQDVNPSLKTKMRIGADRCGGALNVDQTVSSI